MPPITIKLDASMFKESSCLRRVKFRLLDKLVPSGNTWAMNYKASYGTAFHKTVAAFWRGKPVAECLQIGMLHYIENGAAYVGKTDFRTPEHLCKVLQEYLRKLETGEEKLKPAILERICSFCAGTGMQATTGEAGYALNCPRCHGIPTSSSPAIEETFCIPYVRTTDVEILLCGTIDFLGWYNGTRVICDHKVTGAWNIDEYLAEYALSPQLMFYVYCVEKMFPEYKGKVAGLVNGVFIGKAATRWQKSNEIWFTEEQMKGFEDSLKVLTGKLLQSREFASIMDAPNYTQCSRKFGELTTSMCPYFRVCSIPEDQRADALEMHYTHEDYDPLSFQEEKD